MIQIFLIISLVLCSITVVVIFYTKSKIIQNLKKSLENLHYNHNELILSNKLLENRYNILKETSSELTTKLQSKENDLNTIRKEINLYTQSIAELNFANKTLTETKLSQLEIIDNQNIKIEQLNQEVNKLILQGTMLKANKLSLEEKLENQKTEVVEIQKTAHLQFEKLANQLLEEKSKNFVETNKANIEILLNPLKDDIKKFKERIENTHLEETKQRSSLEERIKGLIEQTNKVSNEANNLAAALKGKSQKRGNWGEVILERILEASGLTKNREYYVQKSITNEVGSNQRLDVLVNLPDERIIIIDSKVSLIAYDQYLSSEDVEKQNLLLKEHLQSVKRHIDQLSGKNYDNIETSLDFTMMFIPIEPAYLLAVQSDTDLWEYAYQKRILLVSPTTLIACLKLFSDLWRRKWQNKNALEIVYRGERIYNKLIGFLESFNDIGEKLDMASEIYKSAFKQLSTGSGNLISQTIKLKNLGLKQQDKHIPENYLLNNDEIIVDDNNEKI